MSPRRWARDVRDADLHRLVIGVVPVLPADDGRLWIDAEAVGHVGRRRLVRDGSALSPWGAALLHDLNAERGQAGLAAQTPGVPVGAQAH